MVQVSTKRKNKFSFTDFVIFLNYFTNTRTLSPFDTFGTNNFSHAILHIHILSEKYISFALCVWKNISMWIFSSSTWSIAYIFLWQINFTYCSCCCFIIAFLHKAINNIWNTSNRHICKNNIEILHAWRGVEQNHFIG